MKNSSVVFMILLVSFYHGPIFACTGFIASEGDTVLVGNTEDTWTYKKHPVEIRFVPAEEGKHGAVYFFYGGFYQGGMNDQGLFFDAFITPISPPDVALTKQKPKFEGRLTTTALGLYSTVTETLDFLDSYNLEVIGENQWFFADRTGDSAIVEGDVILRKKGKYQVVTNFRRSHVADDEAPCEWSKIGCGRYKKAEKLLKQCQDISVECFRDIMKEIYQNNIIAKTIYANVYDLENGLIYVYRSHDFENEVVVDLKAELKKGKRTIDLATLFP